MALKLLAAGVPISLLLDLSGPTGPDSADILRTEGGDLSWLRRPEPGNPNGPSAAGRRPPKANS